MKKQILVGVVFALFTIATFFIACGSEVPENSENFGIDFSITINANSGTVEAPPRAMPGATITLTIIPASDHFLESISATTTSGVVTLSGDGNTRTFTMPNVNVIVTAVFVQISRFNINIQAVTGGIVTAAPTIALENEQVTLTITPEIGYRLANIIAASVSGAIMLSGDGNTRTFTMPNRDVTVTAAFELLPPLRNITIVQPENGSITAPETAHETDLVSLTVTPNSGYRVQAVTVTLVEGGTVEASGSDSTWTFTMPASDVTVTAILEEGQAGDRFVLWNFEEMPIAAFSFWGNTSTSRVTDPAIIRHGRPGALQINYPGGYGWRVMRAPYNPPLDLSEFTVVRIWARSAYAPLTVDFVMEAQPVPGTWIYSIYTIGPWETANEWQEFVFELNNPSGTSTAGPVSLESMPFWFLRQWTGDSGQFWICTIVVE
ncbi:MAG: hypothetical protein FWC97_00095 [Treponema sp.]|nr:hypothetical protein [Treponema sp.]